MSTFDEVVTSISNPIKDIASLYVGVLNNRYQQGLTNRQTTIDELKATTGLLTQQNEAARLAAASNNTSNDLSAYVKKYGGWVALAVGGYFAYKLIK